jgi:ribosomal protein S18 acetylase RimI-like enzyme
LTSWWWIGIGVASVGWRLVEEAMRVAQMRGCCEMEVSTERSNQAAQAFYRRLGFSHEAVFMELEFDG